MRCLSTFSGCGWAYGFILTPLPSQTIPQICESWLKYFLLQVGRRCHYALVEAVEPFKLHPMSISYIYEVFEHLLRLWMGIWLHTYTITSTDISPDLWELPGILPDANCKPCNYNLFEAEEPFKLHPTSMSMSYIHKVFEHLLGLLMGIWLLNHTVSTTTNTSPDLWKLAEILPDESLPTMPLRFGWGCRTF